MNRRRMWAVCVLLALALGLALAPAAQAQTAGANLIGRVQDKEGTPLPGVTITATQEETGFTAARSPRATAPSGCRPCPSASTPSRLSSTASLP